MARTTQRRASFHDERGLTLVELLLAIVLLGVIFSAAAGALIGFSRSSVDNELRVQATALLSALHEELQATPWDQAAIYEDDVADLDAIGADTGATPPTYNGNEIVVLPEPVDGRLPFVPSGFEQDVEIDGRLYDVYRVVTWVDRSGDGEADVKRFTTVVRWTSLGRNLEEVFESERAPTAAEVAVQPTPALELYTVTPTTQLLDAAGRNTVPIQVEARFQQGMNSAEVSYTTLDAGGNDVTSTLALTGSLLDGALFTRWTGTIPAFGAVFPEGEVSFDLVGFLGLTEITEQLLVEFLPAGSVTPDPEPVVTSVTVNKSSINVGSSGANAGRLQCELRITARVNGLLPGGTVTATYAAGAPEGADMTLIGALTGTNDEFRLVFANNSNSAWTAPTSDVFTVIARNGAQSSTAVSSTTVNFNSANSTC